MKIIILLLLAISAATAKDVTAAWDSNPPPAPAKYKLYWGPSSRSYTNSISTTNTQATISNLPPGTYFIAATAVDALGLESDYSDELTFTIQPKPVGFKIILSLQSTPSIGQPWIEETNLVTDIAATDLQRFYRGSMAITSQDPGKALR